MTKRKDNKGRVLKTGESQRQDGRYAYKYRGSDGKDKFLYSWRLNDTDPIPKGKRFCKPLRELEKDLQRDLMDGIDSSGKKMTLWQLYEKHNALILSYFLGSLHLPLPRNFHFTSPCIAGLKSISCFLNNLLIRCMQILRHSESNTDYSIGGFFCAYILGMG